MHTHSDHHSHNNAYTNRAGSAGLFLPALRSSAPAFAAKPDQSSAGQQSDRRVCRGVGGLKGRDHSEH